MKLQEYFIKLIKCGPMGQMGRCSYYSTSYRQPSTGAISKQLDVFSVKMFKADTKINLDADHVKKEYIVAESRSKGTYWAF